MWGSRPRLPGASRGRLAHTFPIAWSYLVDVINLAGELRHSIETGNQIHACLALQQDETKDETP